MALSEVGLNEVVDWDPNYFKTTDEVVEMLKAQHGDPKLVHNTEYGSLVISFEGDIAYNCFYFGSDDRVYRIVKYPELLNIKVPISLPVGIKTTVLPAGRIIYRMCNDDETPKIGKPRFYAENLTFDFARTATGGHRDRGGLYEYEILTPTVIVNFDKRWRSRLWGGDDDNKGPHLRYAEYEELIQQVCEEVGAQGWRAACWSDQRNPQDISSAEFEIALFSSNLVRRRRKLYTDITLGSQRSSWTQIPKLRF